MPGESYVVDLYKSSVMAGGVISVTIKLAHDSTAMAGLRRMSGKLVQAVTVKWQIRCFRRRIRRDTRSVLNAGNQAGVNPIWEVSGSPQGRQHRAGCQSRW